jgi:cytochrome c oxidase assembly factor CtaG
MKLALALLLLLVMRSSAPAHGSPIDDLTASGAWTDDLGVIIPLYVAALLYLLGTWRLWRRAGHGRGIRYRQAGSFWSGWTVLALALLSPLHWLSEHLFAAHMVEHELMMLVAAPLLVLSRPIGAFLWALPQNWRRGLGGVAHLNWFSTCWHFLCRPTVAILLHGVAIWGWHVPAAFTAALDHITLHWLQHLSFLVTALLFWWSLFNGRERAAGYGAGVFWLFITAMHTSALGIILTLSKTPWVPFQTDLSAGWGLTPLEDQQLAGLIMWVPASVIYTAVALIMAAKWVRASGRSTTIGGADARWPKALGYGDRGSGADRWVVRSDARSA